MLPASMHGELLTHLLALRDTKMEIQAHLSVEKHMMDPIHSSSDYYVVVANMIRDHELVSPQLEQVLIALVRRGYISVEESNALLQLAGDSNKE